VAFAYYVIAALAYLWLSGHTLSNHTRQEFYSLTYSADGSWLATGDSGGNVELWKMPSGKRVRSIIVRGGEARVAFSPDSLRLKTGDSGGIVNVWNVETGEKLQDNFLYGSIIRSVAFSPDGTVLVAMGSTVNPDRTDSVKLWFLDAGRLQLIRTLDTRTGGGAYLGSLAFSPDGRWLALGVDDLLLINVATGGIRKLESLSSMGWGYSVSFSTDGQRLASAGSNLRLWEVASGQLLRTLRGFNRYMTYSASHSSDGRWLASGSNELDLWNLETGTKTEILDNCAKYEVNCAVLSVAFRPDGKWFASGTQEGTLQLWNMRAIRLKNHLQ
jgi:WD40 repeat protein